MTTGDGLTPEQHAQVLIDGQLRTAGWSVCDAADLDLVHHPHTAVREVRMKRGHGQVDHLLYVDRRIIGVVEDRLPFVVEASGSETHLTNGYDPSPRARRVFAVPQPQTLSRIVREAAASPSAPTWRAEVAQLPPLDVAGLRPAQVVAVAGVGRSPALVGQVRRNAEARADLARDVGLLDAAQVARVHGSRARNSAAVASRLRKEGRIFTVRTEDGARFPALQFDSHGRPRAVVAEVLSALEGRLSDWDVALWFTGRTGWLGDLRPVDLLDGTQEEQAAVVAAAGHLAADLSA